jgi:hypothetical protein
MEVDGSGWKWLEVDGELDGSKKKQSEVDGS